MHGTLSPRFPLHGVALPTASPTSEPPTDFLAPPLGTAALPAWPGSVHAPGVAPTACFRLAPLVPIEPGPPVRASVDPAVVPPGNAARPAYPEPARALVDNLFLQTGPGRRYNDRREIRPADQSSASVTKLRTAHSARSLAVRLGLCVPSQVAPRDSFKLLAWSCAWFATNSSHAMYAGYLLCKQMPHLSMGGRIRPPRGCAGVRCAGSNCLRP